MKRLLEILHERLRADATVLVDLRHQLHAIPEPAHQEWETADLIRRSVGSISDEIGTATVVHIGPTDRGSVILRAELDGLEIVEPRHTPYASRNGWMHACGHDINMAALVGVVHALRSIEDQLPIGVTAVFQPAEETFPSGAQLLVDNAERLFQNPVAAVAVHPHPAVPRQHVAAGAGTVNAAADEFTFTIEGTGGHGAYPHRADDVIVATSAAVMAIQQVVSRKIDPLEPAVITIGAMHSGSAANVLPGSATCIGTMRAMSEEVRETLHRLLASTVAATAAAYGCSAAVHIDRGDPPLVNDPALVTSFKQWARRSSLGIASLPISMGSDDLSRFAEIAPTLLVFAGAPSQIQASRAQPVFLHDADYVPHDDVVALTAAAYCCGVAAGHESTLAADGIRAQH